MKKGIAALGAAAMDYEKIAYQVSGYFASKSLIFLWKVSICLQFNNLKPDKSLDIFNIREI
jgi:hypothetical protein